MAKTATMKNKHAGPKGGSKGGAKGGAAGGGGGDKDSVRSRKPKPKTPIVSKQVTGKGAGVAKKVKKRVYTAEELGVPKLNMITPIGVEKPKGKKKGKVFVDDREGMSTILALVQADQNGQIESKMIKARQLEEIREARKAEAAKKEEARKEKIENTKDALRKKRKRKGGPDEDDFNVKEAAAAGTRSKRVSFA